MCIVAKEPVPKVKVTMKHLIANYPLDIVAMDFTILEKSSSGIENVLVLTDIFIVGELSRKIVHFIANL